MSARKEMTGLRFGRLKVLTFVGSVRNGTGAVATWKCRCDCGKLVVVRGDYLRNGHTSSCGCAKIDRIRELGVRNVSSGHLASLRTHEHQVAAGRAGGTVSGKRNGRKAVESGQFARMQELPQTQAARIANGRKNGRRNVETGHWKKVRLLAIEKKKDTKPERRVGRILDSLGVSYQHPFNLNDKFLCDFYLPNHNLIIEVDGCYWHGCQECGYEGLPRNKNNDKAKSSYLRTCGYRLLTIPEHLTLNQIKKEMRNRNVS